VVWAGYGVCRYFVLRRSRFEIGMTVVVGCWLVGWCAQILIFIRMTISLFGMTVTVGTLLSDSVVRSMLATDFHPFGCAQDRLSFLLAIDRAGTSPRS